MNMDERVKRAKACRGWTGFDELKWLGLQAAGKRLVIELGSWCGGSGVMTSLAEKLICVDVWDDCTDGKPGDAVKSGVSPFKEWSKNLRPEIKSGRVEARKCNLYDAAQISKLVQEFEGNADMVFIDAAHDRDSVATDIRTARRLLKPGGLLCGHDYQFEGVNEAVNALVPKHENPVKSIWVQA